MNNLNFNHNGGLMAFQEVLKFMQTSYNDAISAICATYGQYIILEGCDIVGQNISAGKVIIDGEWLPFEGGTNLGFITINETTSNRLFRDQTMKPLYYTRKAISASSGIPVNSFFRVATIKLLTQHLAEPNPHGINKTKVGLSNIPNAISESLVLDSNEYLATSKAVFLLNKRIIIGTHHVGNLGIWPDNVFIIDHTANTTEYSVFITQIHANTVEWDIRNIFSISEKNETNFKVRATEFNTDRTQDIYLDWLIIKK